MADNSLTLAVAAYKVGEFLGECIESATSQPDDFSMIVADDGSPDNTARTADEAALRDPRVTALHFKNAGVSVARNNALDLCRTKYLWYIDGDDMTAPGSIAKIKRLISGGEEIVLFSRRIFGTDDVPAGEDFALSKDDILNLRYKNLSDFKTPRLNRVAAMSMNTFVIDVDYMRRNDVRFLPGLRKSQDVLFNARAFKNLASARFHDEPFYVYRPNEGSVSMRYITYAPESYVTLIEHLARLLGAELETNPVMRRKLCARAAWCVREALRSCYCHIDNKKPYRERKKEYREFMKNATMRTYFRAAKQKDLIIIDKFTAPLARANLFCALNAGSKLVGKLLLSRMRANKAVYKNA